MQTMARNARGMKLMAAALAAALLAGCFGSSDAQGPGVDAALSAVIAREGLAGDPAVGLTVPAPDAPLAALGRDLFFTKALSGNKDVACASCHHPELGGGDGLSLPVGVNAIDPLVLGPGRMHDAAKAANDPSANAGPNVPRNAQTTFNSGLYRNVLFHDGRVRFIDPADHSKGIMTPDSAMDFFSADPDVGGDLLAVQARFPVGSHAEMRGFDAFAAMGGDDLRTYLAARIGNYAPAAGDTPYNDWLARFRAAFNQPLATAQQVVTYDNIALALAEYERSQTLVDNPWFRYVKGDRNAIGADAKAGALLFFRDVADGGAGCFRCHTGDHFTDEKFHAIAVPQIGRGKTQGGNSEDPGAALFSPLGHEADYEFRTPSLLNVEVTAPYGHDGAYASLDDIIRHHLDPAGSVAMFDFTLMALAQFNGLPVRYPNAAANTNAALARYIALRDGGQSLLQEAHLADAQVMQLKAFLLALTDPCTQAQACLEQWIPPVATPDPDGLRLVASFPGYHNPGLAPPDAVPPVYVGTLGTVNVAATLTAPACASGVLTPAAAGTYRDGAADAGISVNMAWTPDYAGTDQDPFLEELMMAGGVSSADIDGDCLPDLYIANGGAPGNRLYRNNGNGTFTDVSAGSAVDLVGNYSSSAFADIDGDGKLDLIVGGIKFESTRVFLGDGAFHFAEVTLTSGITARSGTYSVTAADYNLDGLVDLFLTHWSASGAALEQNIWRNTGAGVFVGARAEAGIRGELSTSHTFDGNFIDTDGDNWPDLLSTADFGKTQVFRNYGGNPDKFVNATRQSVITDRSGMGTAVADFDGDGDFDWFVTTIYKPNLPAYDGNHLYINDGAGHFAPAANANGALDGGWAWGACGEDLDLDGAPDIFNTNGYGGLFPPGPNTIDPYFLATRPRLFMNDGTGHFTDRAVASGMDVAASGRGVVCFDYDRDGDIDVLVGLNGGHPQLWLNSVRDSAPSTHHYLSVKLSYPGTNTEAVGAVVKATVGGRTMIRQVGGQNGFEAMGPLEAHFGLGTATQVDSLEILWPARVDGGTGKSIRDRSVFTNVAGDRYVVIAHP